MATILFYSPFNQRSRDTESLMIAFHRQGHKVISLSQQEGLVIHDFLKANGIETYTHVLSGERSGSWYYFRHLLFFISFCRKHRVEVVYSHLEPANFVASIGQYFIPGTTYLCRHHIDEGMLYRFDKDFYYRLTYRFARKIIVVSRHAKRYMVQMEGIPENKIWHINLAYDFSLYKNPDETEVRQIRSRYPGSVMLLSACRLTAFKRPDLVIQVAKKLVDEGLDVNLVMLGKGEMQEVLQTMISELGLAQRVFMPGYVDNILDFMAAADFFLHPSVLDSSCVAIKEAGLVKLPVIVCNGVGDFEEYIVDGKNGFSVDRGKFVEAASAIVQQHYRNKEFLNDMGESLMRSVLAHFSIENVIGQYSSLNRSGQ